MQTRLLTIFFIMAFTPAIFAAKITIRNSLGHNSSIKVTQNKKVIWSGIVKKNDEIILKVKKGKVVIFYKTLGKLKRIVRNVKGAFMYFILK